MSFYGTSFSFDGVSCEAFDLVLYDINTTEQGESQFASNVEIEEDRLPRHYRSVYYGCTQNEALEFTLVMCANERRVASGVPFDRWDMERISSWLTGKDGYRWLQIDQPDMIGRRYRCVIQELQAVEVFHGKWGFQCKVSCDSPFAYTTPQTFVVEAAGTLEQPTTALIRSESSYNGWYYPLVSIQLAGGGSISITNKSDFGYTATLTDLPTAITKVTMNGETGIIENDADLNIYSNSNFHFPRLVRGDNQLEIIGTGTVTFTCEFPVNVGG